jgi:hypothetical protein
MKTGAVDPFNPVLAGGYAVTFQPSDFQIRVRFQIRHISITGPAGSSLQIYVDTTFLDTTPRGDLNSWDPAQPLPVIPGQSLYFYWDASTGSIPNVTLDCYQEQGGFWE